MKKKMKLSKVVVRQSTKAHGVVPGDLDREAYVLETGVFHDERWRW